MPGSIEPWNCVCWSMAPNWPYPPPPGPLPADAERHDDGLEDYSGDGGIDEATEFRVGDDSDDDTFYGFSPSSSLDATDFLLVEEQDDEGLLQVDGGSDFPEIVEPINENILNNLMVEVLVRRSF